ncbi:peptide deformylase [Neofamilia massiliensis]|uniref:peptide deformylase n=1 Tax=Neofamilia massiliensis TaxID=1673724 RepID=UPI0006BB5FDA|nr:peptide deformylase [Neofamilia massiliensis]
MAKRIIRTDEDPILRKKSRKVDKIDDKILVLLDDMVETMYDANGVGLAAPQIGVLRRLVVIDIGEGPMKLINPEITFTAGEEEDLEGCLSVPGYNGLVKRPEKLNCKYTDENNENIELEAEGFLARAICHEIDHLDGILYTDKAETMYRIEEENA